MQIKIVNKIGEKVEDYQKRTGATKTWIAKQMGMSSSRMYQIIESENMMVDVIAKFALVLNCKIDDLVEYMDLDKT